MIVRVGVHAKADTSGIRMVCATKRILASLRITKSKFHFNLEHARRNSGKENWNGFEASIGSSSCSFVKQLQCTGEEELHLLLQFGLHYQYVTHSPTRIDTAFYSRK